MLHGMATQWRAFQRFAEHLVFNEGPKLVKQLQNPQSMQRNIQQGITQGLQKGLNQGIRLGLEALAASAAEQRAAVNRAAIPAGRPVSSQTVPTAQRARKVVYAPDLTAAPIPARSSGPGWSTKTIRRAARTVPCWWWAATARHCWD